ncbi:MAG: glycosyltransferase family 10 domain-containing protein [Opitutales bacterium]
MTTKSKKRIAIVDAGLRPEIVETVLPFIHDRYDLELTTDYDADYVFHSCLGCDVLNYSGVRIFVTGECVTPDFNISDYALAFDYLTFGDRYCRLPLIKLFRDAYDALCQPRPPASEILAQKSGFCAYVMSNTKDSAKERIDVFEALTKYKQVDSGGKWRNNVGGPVDDKIVFQSKYKFALAIENASHPGYLTEKFAQAAQSNCVPIYWGDPTITDYLNPKAFINCHEFDSIEGLVEHIRMIDQDDAKYQQMLQEPWFVDSREPNAWRDEAYSDFLCNILDQPHEQAYRRNRSRWGVKYVKRIKPSSRLRSFLRKRK